MPENLGNHDPALKDVYFIEGIGLCSNIFAFTEGSDIALVDTGSGMAPSSVAPPLEQLRLEIENVSRVIITHGHIDHVGGLTEITEHCSPQVFIHKNDADELDSLGIKSPSYLNDGDVIRLGHRDLTVIHTPGHTEGSICLHDNELILTGDTVFPDGLFGRTDLPSGDWRKLIDSLDKLSRLNVRIMLPGHEEPLLSDASSHLKMSRKTAELVRYQLVIACIDRMQDQHPKPMNPQSHATGDSELQIGLIANSHDCLPRIRDVIDRLNTEPVELVLHAGDYSAPFVT